MWYEVLPACGVVMACIYFPHPLYYIMNKVCFNGKAVQRDFVNTPADYKLNLRDLRLNGSVYHARGLEALDDKSEPHNAQRKWF